MKDETYKRAASILRIHPDILKAIVEHAKEIDNQFKMMDVSPKDNIYAVKIIVQDKDENWYVSQDEPNDDKLWADARSDDRGMEMEWEYEGDEEDDDEDGDGGAPLKPVEPVLK